jgi:hypothetical protein
MFIYSFMSFRDVGMNATKALDMLETQLYSDYNIVRNGQTPQILRPNTKLPN